MQTDFWKESRDKTRQLTFWQGLINWIVITVSGLLGKRAKPVFTALGLLRQGSAFVVDLSSWQPKANIEAMIDAGVNHIILRMIYPAQYLYDNWNLTEDTTYRAFYTRIRNYAKTVGKTVYIGAYVVYCAGVEDQNYELYTAYTDAINQAIGGVYLPDYFIIDDEVNKWSQNGKTVYSTAVNQMKGCRALRNKIWNKWHKIVVLYTARWFLNQKDSSGVTYLSQYEVWLDNANGSTEGITVPLWMAWYPVTMSEIFQTVADVMNKITEPTGQQEVALLSIGSFTKYLLWQFGVVTISGFNKNAAGLPAGVDCNISRGTLAEFNAALNLTTVTPPPDTGGDDEQPPTELTARVTALEADVEELIKFRDYIKAA